jgi:cullin-associated NEDD8-dissociated protein 1
MIFFARKALKTITAELPPDGKIAVTACFKLTPKLLVQVANVCLIHLLSELSIHSTLTQPDTPSESLIEALSILSILIGRFPTNLSGATLIPHPLAVLPPLLEHQRPVVRKRAIITLAQFIPISQPELFTQLLKAHVYPFLTPSANTEKQRTTMHLVAAVARHSAGQIAPVLNDIVPGILTAVQKNDDELREGGLQVYNFILKHWESTDLSILQALETLVLRCQTEITTFLNSIMQVGCQFIKYDPVGLMYLISRQVSS